MSLDHPAWSSYSNTLNLITSCRTGNWEGYLLLLENIIKYFFAHDLLNYARLMPVHLAQMNALETEDPETWNALKSGGCVVAKSEIPFTDMFTDQALEQEIKLKGQGGMVGLNRDEGALDHLVTLGFTLFSGADWGGKFVGITTKKHGPMPT